MTQRLSRSDFEHLVVAESPDLALLLSAEGDETRTVQAAGAAWELFGWSPESFEGARLLDRVVLEDAPAVQRATRLALRGEVAAAHFRMECADGGTRWCEIVLRPLGAAAVGSGVIAFVRDLTDRRASEDALTRQAETDPLTGTANRAVFRDRLQHALSRLSRSDGAVGVLFLDLDHFKTINDSMGHHVGDRILTATAQRVSAFLRPSDTLARLGGDEFGVLLEDLASAEAATALAQRIAAAGRFPLSIGGDEVVCTVSVGVAVTDDAKADVDELLRRADRAMYRAKRAGRDGYYVFDERLRGLVLRQLDTEGMIRRAIDDSGLVLQYQPILSLPGQQVVAAEALVRIRSNGSSLVLPEAFLDVANETGQVRQIDSWVLRNAALQAEVWQLSESITVNVNLTARHLGDPHFPDELLALVQEHSLAPGTLAVEVTEDVLERLPRWAVASLHSLRARGVLVVLDDFGAGRCSLAMVRSLPLDGVKLDRRSVAELESSPRARSLVGAVVALCHDLDLRVLAVGVETPRQLEILTELGCDKAQGFLLAGSGDPAEVRLPVQRSDRRRLSSGAGAAAVGSASPLAEAARRR